MSAPSAHFLTRQWIGHLAHYRNHSNDEHYEALVAEALKYVGLALEDPLASSPYWSGAPLARRVAVLLFLVDRGVVDRVQRDGRPTYEAKTNAEEWTVSQQTLQPYLQPTLEFIAALRQDRARRLTPRV